MSERSTRKRRSTSATPGVEDTQELGAEQQTQTRRTRQRNSGGSTPDPALQNGSGALVLADGAAAAAPGRVRQQHIHVEQREADAMTDKIQQLSEAAEEARERAHDAGFSDNAINEQVAKAVRFMLYKNFEKPDVPVKRQEIVEALQKDQPKSKNNKKLPALVLTMAAGKLATVFGLELLELKRTAGGDAARRAGAAAAAGPDGPDGDEPAAAAVTTQTYVLRSLLPTALQRSHNLDPDDDAKRGLMSTIAALLTLAGGQMETDELWRHLSQLGVDREEEANQFGRKGAAEVLAHMEKARYLVLNKVTVAGGGFQQMYSLGENACDLEGPRLKAMVDRWLSNAPGGGSANAEVEVDEQ